MKNLLNCALVLLVGSSVCAAQTTTTSQSQTITPEQFIMQAALSGMKEVETGKVARQKAQNARIKDFATMMTKDHGKANAELMTLAKAKNVKLPKQTSSQGSTQTNASTSASGTHHAATADRNTSTGTTNTTGTTGTTNSSGLTGNNNNNNNNTGNAGNSGNNNANPSNKMNNDMTGQNGRDSLKMMTEMDISTAVQQLNSTDGQAFDSAYSQMMIMDHQNAIMLFERGSRSDDPEVKAFATKHLPTLRNHLQQISSISSPGGQGAGSGSGSGNTGKNN